MAKNLLPEIIGHIENSISNIKKNIRTLIPSIAILVSGCAQVTSTLEHRVTQPIIQTSSLQWEKRMAEEFQQKLKIVFPEARLLVSNVTPVRDNKQLVRILGFQWNSQQQIIKINTFEDMDSIKEKVYALEKKLMPVYNKLMKIHADIETKTDIIHAEMRNPSHASEYEGLITVLVREELLEQEKATYEIEKEFPGAMGTLLNAIIFLKGDIEQLDALAFTYMAMAPINWAIEQYKSGEVPGTINIDIAKCEKLLLRGRAIRNYSSYANRFARLKDDYLALHTGKKLEYSGPTD